MDCIVNRARNNYDNNKVVLIIIIIIVIRNSNNNDCARKTRDVTTYINRPYDFPTGYYPFEIIINIHLEDILMNTEKK